MWPHSVAIAIGPIPYEVRRTCPHSVATTIGVGLYSEYLCLTMFCLYFNHRLCPSFDEVYINIESRRSLLRVFVPKYNESLYINIE